MIKKTAEINIKSDADKAAQGISNIKKDLREANMALIEAQGNFGEYSKEAVNAARKVAELKDRIADAKETADLFDPGKKFQAFSGALTAVAGGFSVVTGAMGALGAESEDVEKLLLKVNSAMALTTGLSAIADSSKDFKRLGAIASTSFSSIQTAAKSAFTGIKGGLAATGIGIFLIALGAIVANWDDIKKSIEKAFPAFKNIGTLFNSIKQIAFGAGEAIKNYILMPFKALGKLLQGDFKGAIAEVKNGFNVVGNYQKGAAKEAQSQADEAAKVKLEKQIAANEKSLEVQKAAGKDTYNQELALLKQKQKLYKDDATKIAELKQEEAILVAAHGKKVSDINKAASDKAAAAKKAADDKTKAEKEANDAAILQLQNKLNDDIENLEDDNAQKKLDRQKQRELEEINSLKGKTDTELKLLKESHEKKFSLLQEALNKESGEKDKKEKEDLQKQIDATSKEISSEIEKNTVKKSLQDATNIEELIALNTQLQNELDIKQAARVKEFEDRQAIDAIAKAKEFGQDSQEYKDLLTQQGVEINALKESQGSEDVALKQQFSDAKKKIDDIEEQNQIRKVAAIGQTLASAAQLLGEHTIAGKALAIAATTIDTFQSSVSAYKGMVAAIPGPGGVAAGAVAAAAAIASGLATVKKIVSVKVPAKGGAGAGAGAAPSAPPKPSVSFQNTPQTQVADSINEAAQNRNSQLVRAYVVSGDVTTAQSLDRNRIDGATF